MTQKLRGGRQVPEAPVPTGYASAYESRIFNTSHPSGLELWRLFEEQPLNWVEQLLSELEYAVSHGFFGLAAEISDLLGMTAAKELASSPAWLVRFETERMKRLVYMGYVGLANAAARRVVALVASLEGQLERSEAAFWQRTAVGYQGWTCGDPEQLDGLLVECKRLESLMYPGSRIPTEARAFSHGLRGRAHALRGAKARSRTSFERGIKLVQSGDHRRSWSHLQVLYAEHLGVVGEWAAAANEMRRFLDKAATMQLRSHLFLRAIRFLLFVVPNELLPEHERRQLEFRWRILLDGMGVSRSRPIAPFISHVTGDSATNWDILTVDDRSALTKWLRNLDGDGMEALVAEVYRQFGYSVTKLDSGAPALDLIAVQNNYDGTRSAVGIQVKHWLSRPVKKEAIPEETEFEAIKRSIQGAPDHVMPTSLHWYCSSGMSVYAADLLRNRAQRFFGDGCQVRTTSLEELVTIMLRRPEILQSVVLTVHANQLFGKNWGGTH